MNRKNLINIFIVCILTVSFVVASCCIYKKCDRYSVNTVIANPRGYVPLQKIIELSYGELNYFFWETQISIIDSDNNCIFQTSVKDKDFIVKYKGNYYIGEEYIGVFAKYIE